jgi:hypothetical protein
MKMLRAIYLYVGFLLTLSTLLHAESTYKYSYVPKKVYENQLFPVTIIGIEKKNSQIPSFHFSSHTQSKALFEKPLVIHNGNDSFYTFYFQARKKDIHIPSIRIDDASQHIELPSQTIHIQKLQKTKDFSHVLAADLKIKNSQVSNYDEKNHIVTLSIEAYEANLQDMKLYDSNESGVDSLYRNFSKVTGDFYVVVPQNQKELKFTYFNTIKQQFITKKIPILLEDSSISTQSELNPKEDNFEKLKKYTLMILSAFFLLMFLFKRDFFYLVFGVISVITLLTLYIPHKKICVSQGAPLYILPTATSTISTKIDAKLDTLLLGERKGYKKVEYKKGIVGWIKNEDLCQN